MQNVLLFFLGCQGSWMLFFASQIPHWSQEFWSFLQNLNSEDEKKKGKIKTNNDKSIIQWVVDIVIRTQIGHDLRRVMNTYYYHNSFSLSNRMNGNRYFHWRHGGVGSQCIFLKKNLEFFLKKQFWNFFNKKLKFIKKLIEKEKKNHKFSNFWCEGLKRRCECTNTNTHT